MSVAYRTNTVFEQVGYDEREAYDRQTEAKAAARSAAHRQAVIARRVVVMVVAVLAAAVCIGLLYVKSQIYMAQRDVNMTQQAIEKAQRLNSVLGEQYSEAMNVNSIMQRAQNLGMGYPTQDQVLYVDLDGSSNMTMKK